LPSACPGHAAPTTPAGAAPTAVAEQERWHWGDTSLPTRRRTKYLGVLLDDECSWDQQAQRALGSGRAALHRWLAVLQNPRINVSIKVQALRTYIVPPMLYGMEIWGPSSRTGLQLRDTAFERQFAGMDQVLHKALKHATGVWRASSSWQDASCVRADIMMRDAAVLPVHAENDLAHLRLRRRAVQGLSVDDTDPLLAAVYTHMQRGAGTPWLQQCERGRNSLNGLPVEPSNAQLRAAVRQREGQRMAERAASIPHRDLSASAGSTRPRSQRASGTAAVSVLHTNPLSPLLAAPAGVREAFLRAPARDVAPVLMLRSLHLPSDRAAHAAYTRDSYKCMFCGHCVADPECTCTEAELRWRHIRHSLCACASVPGVASARHGLHSSAVGVAMGAQFARVRAGCTRAAADPAVLLPFLLNPASVCGAQSPLISSLVGLASEFLCAAGTALAMAPLAASCVRGPFPNPLRLHDAREGVANC